MVLLFPAGLKAAHQPVKKTVDSISYVLYQKPASKSWQDVRNELSLQISDIERWQRVLAQQYGLYFQSSSLLPADARLAQVYPRVTLAAIAERESLSDFAWRYRLSPEQLINLNRHVKSPSQLADLSGQWVIVPDERRTSDTGTSEGSEKLRDILGSFWQSAQSNGAISSARTQAQNAASAFLTTEVENWLNQSGARSRVSAGFDLTKGSSADFGLDYLYPFFNGQQDTLFVQLNGHRWNARNTLNAGIGWRHNFNPQLVGGANAFYDQDITRHHSRLGMGLELWSERLHGAVNYYLPLSDWKRSDAPFLEDKAHYNLYERAARGWDLNVEAVLSKNLSARTTLFQWFGDKVDVNGNRSEASKNPHGLNLGVKWLPVPLVALRAEQQLITGQRNNFNLGLDLVWEFGRTLSEMLDSSHSQAMSLQALSRTDFVQRNNNIVLAYKEQQKTWNIWFDPAELSAKAGSAAFINQVRGGGNAHIVYRSLRPDIATVESSSGRVTPLRTGETTVYAELYASMKDVRPSATAQYRLSVLPGDFAPSVSEVAIEGEALIGNTLTGHYRYHSNQGEEEAEGGSLQQWFHTDNLSQPLARGAYYQVTADDLDKTLLFRVTPVNKNQQHGEPGTSQIAGPAQQLVDLRLSNLEGGMQIDETTIKLAATESGNVKLSVRAIDEKGNPLAERPVWWSYQGILGQLSTAQSLTDSQGNTEVVLENVSGPAEDTIVASLLAPKLVLTADKDAGQTMPKLLKLKLKVMIVHPSIQLEAQDASLVVPGDTPVTFTAILSETHGLGIAERQIRWLSNGAEVGTSMTDSDGKSDMRLPVPTHYGDGIWRVEAQLSDEGRLAEFAVPLHKKEAPPLSASDITVTYSPELQSKTLMPEGGNGGQMIFRSSDSEVATVDAKGVMTFHNVGKTTVTVSQTATESLVSPADLQINVEVQPASPEVNVTLLPTMLAGATQQLDVRSDSDGSVTWRIDAGKDLATINKNGLLSATKSGKVNVSWVQQATRNYLAAIRTWTVTVNKNAAGALTAEPVSVTYGDAPSALVVSGGNGGAIRFTTADSGVVTVDDRGMLTFRNAGKTTVTVSQAATDSTEAPADLPVSIEVGRKVPAFSATLSEHMQAGATQQLKVTSDSDGQTRWSINEGGDAASVDANGLLTAHKAGQVSVTWTQQATDNYVSAAKTWTVTVNKNAAGALTAEPVSVTYGDAPSALVVSGGNGGAMRFTTADSGVVTVDDRGMLTFRNAGKTTVTVSQAATDSTEAPADLPVSIEVGRKVPAFSATLSEHMQAGATQQLKVTSDSDGQTRWSINEGGDAASVDANGLLTAHKAGQVSVTWTQQATDNYVSAAKTWTVTVNKNAAGALTAEPVSVTYGDAPSALVVSGGNGGAMRFTTADSGVVTVDDRGMLTFRNAGKTTVTVSQAATDSTEAPADLPVSIEVGRKVPAFSATLSEHMQAGATQQLKVTSDSDGQTRWSINEGGDAASVDANGLLTAHKAGQVSVTWTQQATDNYVSAAKTWTVTVNKNAAGALTAEPVSVTYGDAPSALVVSGGNGGAMRFTTADSGVVTVDDRGMLTFRNAGKTTVTVSQAATDSTEAPADLPVSIEVGRKVPAFSATLSEHMQAGATQQLKVTSDSDGPTRWSINEGGDAASVDANGLLTAHKAGQVSVTWTQQATDNYVSAAKTWTVTVNKNAAGALTAEPVSVTYGDAPSALVVSGGNGGAMRFTTADSGVVTVDDRGMLTFRNAGKTTVTVSQAATDSTEAPADLPVSIHVLLKAPPVPAPQEGDMLLGNTFKVSLTGLGLANDDIDVTWMTDKGYSWYGNSELRNGVASFRAWDKQLVGARLYVRVTSKKNPTLSTTSQFTTAIKPVTWHIAQIKHYYYLKFGSGWVYEPQVYVVNNRNMPVEGVEVCFKNTGFGWETWRRVTGQDGTTPGIQAPTSSAYFIAWICKSSTRPGSRAYMGGGNKSWYDAFSDWQTEVPAD
ncbi:inverse autotransporter beta domain-containing protein [Mixta mediterraneensis]|uniref:inverse autotransporter beta domain-containing protein n=1 Tax=Mixta mediterraneensis TaxID=2758443 RepID=UPI001876013A|nr:inverse autotransporter beta domain-containing protein [Mixta mediterraneensis]